MNQREYNIKQNKAVFDCWTIINSVLTIAYIIEAIKGNRTNEFVFIFFVFTWLPFFGTKCISLILGIHDTSIKYYIIAGYNIFYIFVLLTSNSLATFVYIIPMISILIVYNDKILIAIVYSISLLENIIYIIRYININGINSEELTFFEIQIACIVLSMVFMIEANNILRLNIEKIIQLSKDIITDPLTEIYNRGFLNKLIDKIDNNINEMSVSMAIIDIDDFKSLNDTYGHKCGDTVLKKLADIMASYTNRYLETYAIRIGGDEFVILSFTLDKDKLQYICENICNDVSNTYIRLNDTTKINFNISIGVVNSKLSKCKDYNELYTRADELLYDVKENGKNSVSV